MNNPVDQIRLQSTLRKTGNSTGLILPKAILNQLGLANGAKIELRVENGAVILRPVMGKTDENYQESAKCNGPSDLFEEE